MTGVVIRHSSCIMPKIDEYRLTGNAGKESTGFRHERTRMGNVGITHSNKNMQRTTRININIWGDDDVCFEL